MEVAYNPPLIFLSILVAILASYVALNLAYSVTQAKGKAKSIWLACGSIAMGVGIWSMHFVGMLAFEMPGMEMAYDVPLMILSVAVAILGSALALFVVSRPVVRTGSLIASGVAMAAAISGMHYIGMYSMRMAARIEWNFFLVFVSILIALGASFAALTISIRLRNKPDRLVQLLMASTLMGFAIAGMHYTGMIAATFVHDHSIQIEASNLLVSSSLTIATISATTLILGLALISSIGQRIFAARQKQSEEILGNSEEKYRVLVEAVKDYAIFMLDSKGFISTWNSGAGRITGYSYKDIVGKHVSTLNAIEDAEEELKIAREKGHYEGEAIRIRRDGSEFWANIVIDPLFDQNGNLRGYSKVMRDITLIKQSEERTRSINEELERRVQERTLALQEREAQLKHAKEQAEVANETKSAFLANMSHEIRTPLGAVLGFSELMLDGDVTASERVNYIEIIKRNGKLLSDIINDILDLSKVEAGKLEVERANVSLRELINEVSVLLNLEAAGKGIQLVVSSEGPVPNLIKTDSTRLRQILFNIVGNAIKFTEKGTVSLKIKLSPKDAAKIAFIVQDTGTGISAEQAARLFSPFTQADVTTTRKFGGTGLGLALSKKLAAALGGDLILAESALGKGSTFVVTIDHGQADEIIFENPNASDLPDAKVIDLSPHGRQAELSPMKILIVDDSMDNLALIARILRLSGANVETASNGKEGVDKAVNGDFSIVLMDLQMPQMDGYEATKELRKRGFNRPIIALTAHAMKEERKRCLENGFNDHLTKPVDRDRLVQALAGYVG